MEYARAIIAKAIDARAMGLTPAMIDQIATGVHPEDPGQRDWMILCACKDHIRDDIIAIAHHGAPGRDGRHLTGPQALLQLVGVDVGAGSAAAFAEDLLSSLDAADDAQRQLRLVEPDVSRRPLGAKPAKADLLRALKYLGSSALGLRVELASAHPLALKLQPTKGFERRFVEIVNGPVKGGDERAVANTMVLRVLIDVVAKADIAGLRAWLPTIDPGLIFDGSDCGNVLLAYQAELFRRTRIVTGQSGHLGLAALPGDAYQPIDVFEM